MGQMRAAIILEHNGQRLLYEIELDSVEVTEDEGRLFFGFPDSRRGPYRIAVKGLLLHGRIWDAPMPTAEPLEIEGPAEPDYAVPEDPADATNCDSCQ